LPAFLSFSTSIYVMLKFLPFTNLGALVMSVMACLWSSLLASFKSGYFFGLKVGKKGFSRLTLYLLVFTFFVFYQSFFAREEIIVFAQSATTTIPGITTTVPCFSGSGGCLHLCESKYWECEPNYGGEDNGCVGDDCACTCYDVCPEGTQLNPITGECSPPIPPTTIITTVPTTEPPEITTTSTSTTSTTTSTTTTIPTNVQVHGMALDYYTGERINGNITVIPLENPENKTTAAVVNGEWSVNLNMKTEDVENLMFVVESANKKGYNQLMLTTPSSIKPNCTIQNISISGYSLDVSGGEISSGNVIVSVLDTDYSYTNAFSGGTWSIDLHPCLISGQVYTLQVLVSDNTGKRGEIIQKYPAK